MLGYFKKILLASVLMLALAQPATLAFAQGGACVSGSNDPKLCNPIEYSNDLKGFVYKIIQTFTGFFAIAALVMVIYSGLRMVMSQGNEEAITKAKGSLQWAISGLILAMFAFVIVSAVGNYLGVVNLGPSTYTGNNPIVNPVGSGNLLDLITRVLNGFLGIVGLLAVLMIIFGGFKYITSAGNEEQAASAKTTLQWAVIGLVIIILSYVIVRATLTFFNP